MGDVVNPAHEAAGTIAQRAGGVAVRAQVRSWRHAARERTHVDHILADAAGSPRRIVGCAPRPRSHSSSAGRANAAEEFRRLLAPLVG